jgi:hypothetical protein
MRKDIFELLKCGEDDFVEVVRVKKMLLAFQPLILFFIDE